MLQKRTETVIDIQTSKSTTTTTLISISKVAPIYPKELLKKGIEGYCILEFSVTKEGTTEDIKVVECTDYDFANSSIEAAKQFRYIPKIVDGDLRQTVGVLHKMSFELESSQK